MRLILKQRSLSLTLPGHFVMPVYSDDIFCIVQQIEHFSSMSRIDDYLALFVRLHIILSLCFSVFYSLPHSLPLSFIPRVHLVSSSCYMEK